MAAANVERRGLSRRRFLQGVGGVSATIALSRAGFASQAIAGGAAGLGREVSGDFGQLAGASSGYRVLERLQELGVQCLRFPLRWDWVQPSPSSYDWSGYEDLHRLAIWHGFDLRPVVVGCPTSWLDVVEGPTLPSPGGGSAVTNLSMFVVELTKYFNARADRLTSVEIWGRANDRDSNYLDPTIYRAVLESATSAISELNQTPLVGHSISLRPASVADQGDPRGWIEYARALQSPFYDASVTVTRAASNAATPRQYVAEALEVLGRAEDELGASQVSLAAWPTPSKNLAPQDQSDALRQLIDALRESATCAAVAFRPVTASLASDGDDIDGPSDGVPLLDANLEPTIAFSAIQESWLA